MNLPIVRLLARRIAPLALGATTLGAAFVGAPSAASGVVMHPLVADPRRKDDGLYQPGALPAAEQ
jgi:hypothetical protein